MDVNSIKDIWQKTKHILVFFCVVALFFSCTNSNKAITPILEYENGKVVRVLIESDKEPKEFRIYHLDNPNVSILGHFSVDEGYIVFTPALPFSKGKTFAIAHKDEQIAIFKVDEVKAIKAPELDFIYPRNDTVPVNILKMYLVFSEPMQYVGNPLDFITVFDKTDNVRVYPFLDISAELWNKDHTRLTLWFDPGRIKTDLIPNKEKGLPLIKDHSYTITISPNWQSASGSALSQSYSKTIYVIGKDVTSPDPQKWSISAPSKNTKEILRINFHEALDPILALESIKLFKDDNPLSGKLGSPSTDNGIIFEPSHPWKAGDYRIEINPILEDFAGNNLRNLFDSDLRDSPAIEGVVNSITFKIE